MKTFTTDYGSVRVGTPEELFAALAQLGTTAWRGTERGRFGWALTGGSTPKAWYRWCVDQRALPAELVAETHWFVGDERCVPLADDDSNFGHAARLLLDPLGVAEERRHPWRVDLKPAEAAEAFGRDCEAVLGADRGFALCVLGLGEDAHTASLFPGSALLGTATNARFAAIKLVGKGWRLTITPTGLAACAHLVVHATGAAKAPAVRRVFCGEEPALAVPAKILRVFGPRTTWLLDSEAVAGCPQFRG